MTRPNNEIIAFCGEHGAFAELALFRAFGEDAPNLPTAAFAAVFDAVLGGSAAFGVVPVENSLAGSVHENYDLFLQYPDIAIVGEIKIRIVHNLIVRPGAGWDTIKIVRSHPQALAQCKAFLDQHPLWQLGRGTTRPPRLFRLPKKIKIPWPLPPLPQTRRPD
jgi:3-deoxy-7-phosphoheptulonate synthase